jgi:hypothetical protein
MKNRNFIVSYKNLPRANKERSKKRDLIVSIVGRQAPSRGRAHGAVHRDIVAALAQLRQSQQERQESGQRNAA